MMTETKIKLKEYELPYESCMGAWFIPEDICDGLIRYYNHNIKNVIEGETYNDKVLVDHNVKHSYDLYIPRISYHHNDVIQYLWYLNRVIDHFEIKYPDSKNAAAYTISDPFIIQKYPKGGGFKIWHHERSKGLEERIFVFMTYLNDIDNAGTEFLHQKIKIPAKKGLTVFWPADWTHTHRGIITHKDEKMIATGWFDSVIVKKWKDENIKSKNITPKETDISD